MFEVVEVGLAVYDAQTQAQVLQGFKVLLQGLKGRDKLGAQNFGGTA